MNFYHPDWYGEHVSGHPFLGAEEENALIQRYQETGDAEAAKKVIQANLKAVLKIARKFPREDPEDLVQEGNLGMVEALSRFDPDKGSRFYRYASYWIRAYILRYIQDNKGPIKVSNSRAGRLLVFNLHKYQSAYPNATREEIASLVGVPVEEVQAIAPLLSSSYSPLHRIGERGAPSESFLDSQQTSPEEMASAEAARAEVVCLLQSFRREILTKKREIDIWNRRMVTDDPRPLSFLSKEHGVSKQRIRQVENRIREKLRIYLAKYGFRSEQATTFFETQI